MRYNFNCKGTIEVNEEQNNKDSNNTKEQKQVNPEEMLKDLLGKLGSIIKDNSKESVKD